MLDYLPTDFIDKYDNFVIFGASVGGAKTKEYLDKLGKNAVYFLDNDIHKKGKKFLGKTIKHPSEIVMFKNKVLIASVWWREIKQQLEIDFGLIWGIDFFYNVPLNQYRIFGIFIPSKNSVNDLKCI